MTEENKYNLIESYLSGMLIGQEKERFEKQLQEDAQLQEELNLHQQIAETLKGEQVHQLRDVLKKVDKNWQAPAAVKDAKIKRFDFRKVIGIAASVLLLLMAYQFFVSQKSISNEALFADNFQVYNMALSQRSTANGSSNTDLINRAVSAYQGRDFKMAATLFQKLQAENPEIAAFSFYQGLSELALNNSDEAVTLLEKVSQQSDHLFIEQSQWYLALAYLQKGDRAKAKTQLQTITSGAYQYDSAKKILESID